MLNLPDSPDAPADTGPGSPRLCIVTMGCKVNRADSASMAELARSLGFSITRDEHAADLFFLNTCTVTARSDSEARQIIRRLHRASPCARILVGGCLPRAGGDPGAEFDGICTYLKGGDEADFLSAFRKSMGPAASPGSVGAGEGTGLLGRTRPFLKIQDGCDGACTYCIVPRARGASRSLELRTAVEKAGELFRAGHKEVVLVGIHLGAYGRDLRPRSTLTDLLRGITASGAARDEVRVRLTSLEPLEIDDGLLELMASTEKICRHLHVPLQSGSDKVLKLMNRPYATVRYRGVLEAIRGALPDACIGADVISGFPGEAAADHEMTVDFIESLPLDYLHVFTFSPRPGTVAARMQGRPAAAEVGRRVTELRELGERKRLAFHRSMVGRKVGALVEGPAPGGGLNALTSNYIKVRIEDGDLGRGAIVDVVIDGVLTGGKVRARRA